MEKIYEPIDPQDLKDFALFNRRGIPRPRSTKVFLIQAVSYAFLIDGPIEASSIANCPEKPRISEDDPRWQWHLTESESLEIMQLLLDSIQEEQTEHL